MSLQSIEFGPARQQDGTFREANTSLQEQCPKLIEELPELFMHKRGIDEHTPDALRWKAVSKMASKYSGEIVMLEPEETTWSLTKLEREEWLADKYLNSQFSVNERNEPQDVSSKWLGKRAQDNIAFQVQAAANDTGVLPSLKKYSHGQSRTR